GCHTRSHCRALVSGAASRIAARKPNVDTANRIAGSGRLLRAFIRPPLLVSVAALPRAYHAHSARAKQFASSAQAVVRAHRLRSLAAMCEGPDVRMAKPKETALESGPTKDVALVISPTRYHPTMSGRVSIPCVSTFGPSGVTSTSCS